jgi:hypothetical protein
MWWWHTHIFEKGFSAVIYCLQLNPVNSFFSLHIILLNTIIMNGRDANWTSSSYISTGEDLLSTFLIPASVLSRSSPAHFLLLFVLQSSQTSILCSHSKIVSFIISHWMKSCKDGSIEMASEDPNSLSMHIYFSFYTIHFLSRFLNHHIL